MPQVDRSPIRVSPAFRVLGLIILVGFVAASVRSILILGREIPLEALPGLVFLFLVLGLPCVLGRIPHWIVRSTPAWLIRFLRLDLLPNHTTRAR